MAVLVLGGYGLIGSAIVEALLEAGFPVIALGRHVTAARRRLPDVDWREADVARLTRAEDWAPLLAGAEVVVNAVGLLQQGLTDDLAAIQARAMPALYAAAAVAGIRRFVQISATGAEPGAATVFLSGKGDADARLLASGLDAVVLRPGLVLSPVAYGGTAMLRGLAATPLFTPLVYAGSRVQTVWIGDVAEAALAAVRGAIPAGATLDLVERPDHSLAEIVTQVRRWQGLAPARQVALPDWVAALVARGADSLGWLGWRSPMRSTTLSVLRDGVRGRADDAPPHLGRELLTLPQMLRRMPASPQERWFARAWLAKPLVLAVLAGFWIASGVIGLARHDAAEAVLLGRGAGPGFAAASVFVGAVIDMALGLAVLVRPLAGAALKGMVLTSLGYLAAATVVTPDLWFDPLGPLVKIIPAILLALVALATLEAR